MLALCLMLSVTYYAQNYAGIIGWSLIMVAVYIVMTLQHFSNVTCPNILVDVVSSDRRVYSNNDYASDSTSHAIARDDVMRSRT